jgi:molybdate-binding protein
MLKWECTPGTVHRAYRELAAQGLVVSHAGQGTRVVKAVNAGAETPVRLATLVNRAEKFLLEAITSGYSPEEVEHASFLALSHWRVLQQEPANPSTGELQFSGSHDLIMDWVASHLQLMGFTNPIRVQYCGSLGGLIELAEGRADLSGIHLWDEYTGTYNVPYVRRFLPGRRVALFTLAERNLGIILNVNNPLHIQGLEDLTHPDVRFINRQSNSGSRIWLDAQLHRLGIDPKKIHGYPCEYKTHNQVAHAIAEGLADAGLGIEAAARAFSLDFLPLTKERYDLVIPEDKFQTEAVQQFLKWLKLPLAQEQILALGGYSTEHTGEIEWVG